MLTREQNLQCRELVILSREQDLQYAHGCNVARIEGPVPSTNDRFNCTGLLN